MAERGGFAKAFGPGVLFTGAAVGVSHLVQSTRAGALYGFALALLVVAANLVKYPAFRFGPHYAAATGHSLLEGYRRQGRWALVLYAVLTVGTMLAVLAAVTLVTASLLAALLRVTWSPVAMAAGLIAVCAGLIAAGRYRLLDRVNKLVVAVLVVSTLAATILALPRFDWSAVRLLPDPGSIDPAAVFFIAALVGWMPSAIDVAVWQSLWTLARERDSGHRPSLRESLLDFHLGYWSTAFLALCFLTLGAAIMHGAGVRFAEGASGFASQVIDLYSETLGAWSRPLIGTCAFATMFSTTLTVVDGFPRALAVLAARFRAPERPGGIEADREAHPMVYWASLTVLGIGAVALLRFFLTSLQAMVDLATTLSFLTAPLLSWLNHRSVLAPEVPAALRPRPWLVAASWAGIALQGGFAAYYLWLRLG